MKKNSLLLFLLICVHVAFSQQKETRVIVIAAHPDEADEYAGGTGALFAEMGNAVKFVSLTNGDAGHWQMTKDALTKRRYNEAKEAGKRLGVEYDVLNYHDGELENSIQLRKDVVKLIREWKADIVISFFPADGEHPDNMNAGKVVQEAAGFIANVPLFMPEVPCLAKSPVFLYMRDFYTRQLPHQFNIVIPIDETIEKKYASFDAHASQFYEFAPYQKGILNEVPKTPAGRIKFFEKYWGMYSAITPDMKKILEKWYGSKKAAKFQYAEAFEIAPFSRYPSNEEMELLFPMLK
jgi:LmbE family N-acetylglucosaminyl deacetylase